MIYDWEKKTASGTFPSVNLYIVFILEFNNLILYYGDKTIVVPMDENHHFFNCQFNTNNNSWVCVKFLKLVEFVVAILFLEPTTTSAIKIRTRPEGGRVSVTSFAAACFWFESGFLLAQNGWTGSETDDWSPSYSDPSVSIRCWKLADSWQNEPLEFDSPEINNSDSRAVCTP